MHKSKLFTRILSSAYIGFFLLLSLGQFERITLGQLPAFYLHDLAMVGLVLWMMTCGSFRVWVGQYLKKNVKKEHVLLLVVVLIGWTRAVIGGELAAAAPLYLTRLGLYLAAAASTLYLLEKKWLPLAALRFGVLACTAGIAYFGYLQYLFFPDTRVLFFLGWDDHYYRLVSTLFDPGFTGIVLVLGFLFWQSEVSLLAATLFLPAILLTYSRASYLGLGVALAGVFLLALQSTKVRRAALIFSLASCSFLGVFILPRPGGEGVNLQRTASIDARKNSFQSSFQKMSPSDYVFGRGLFLPAARHSDYDTEYHAQQSDSWLATILTGTGVLGTLVMVYIFGKWLCFNWRKYPIFCVALFALLVHGLFNASIFYPFVLLPMLGWWVLLTQRSSRSVSSP